MIESNKHLLQPIGTRFKRCIAPLSTSLMNGQSRALPMDTDMALSNFALIEHEVTEHLELANQQWVEATVAVQIWYYRPLGWTSYRGHLSAIPPREIHPYLSDDWFEPVQVSYCISGDFATDDNLVYHLDKRSKNAPDNSS